MRNFINTISQNYFNKVITDFSNLSRNMSMSAVKSSSDNKYSWVADFLYKQAGNFSINPHIGYVSFISDYDMFIQEYSTIKELTDEYSFLLEFIKQKIPSTSFELTSKQYENIGQYYTEFDSINYTNISEMIFYIESADPTIKRVHNYGLCPVFKSKFYKYEVDSNTDGYFYVYDDGEDMLFLEDSYFSWYPQTYNSERGIPNNVSQKILNYKVQVDNIKFIYFEFPWVCYPDSSRHFVGDKYQPTIYPVEYFDINYNLFHEYLSYYIDTAFLPKITYEGRFEPPKFISDWLRLVSGYAAVNKLCCNNDSKDQSRLLYSVAASIYNEPSGIKRLNHYSEIIYEGLDFNIERNRRYSAIVMTEPYFVTDAILNGKVVEYKFVYSNGENVEQMSYDTFVQSSSSNKIMYLKIKTSMDVINEIDRLLSLNEINTDIINTFTIPSNKFNNLVNGTGDDYYKEFYGTRGSDNIFYARQDDCLDDASGLIAPSYPSPNRQKFRIYINNFASNPQVDFYTEGLTGKMTIAGIGYVCEDGSEELIKVYCSNYKPSGSLNEGSLITSGKEAESISKIEEGEVFKPMIKLPQMNGYIKILKKKSNTVRRTNDGKYEIIYHVEIPYCPGSISARCQGFNEYRLAQIYYKRSYLNAGSWKCYNDKYDIYNERKGFKIDSLLTWGKVLVDHEEISYTLPESRGGTFISYDDIGLGKIPPDVIKYPAGSVYWTDYYSTIKLFNNKDTEDIIFNINCYYDGNYKILLYVDNRRWKYGNESYESYINRENPSYVFGIDLSTLYKDFTKYQSQHSSIPDQKRWIYSYFRGFSSTLKDNEDGTEESVASENCDSDIIIEVWDKTNNPSIGITPNWRPISPSGYDTEKIHGSIIINNVLKNDEKTFNSVYESSDLKEIILQIFYYDDNHIPVYFFDVGTPDPFSDKNTNLVLRQEYLSDNGVLKLARKNYHIAYIESLQVNDQGELVKYEIGSNNLSYFRAYVIMTQDEYETLPSKQDAIPYGTPPLMGIYDSNENMNKSSFDLFSSKAKSGTDSGYIIKCLDLKTKDTGGDFDRYVDSENKVYFRIRVSRKKDFPLSYKTKDYSLFQHARKIYFSYPSTYSVYSNLYPVYNEKSIIPWYNEDTHEYDTAFDWSKIILRERVSRFGIDYFKCASK